jgi:hypothetical protein
MGVFFHKWFTSFPDIALSVILLMSALVLAFIAVFGKPIHKALACAWVVLP